MTAVWLERPPSLAGASVSHVLVTDVLAAALRSAGHTTRADLEHALNVQLSAVSKAVKFLVSERFIKEVGSARAGLGRPVSLLTADDKFLLVGLYLTDIEQPGDVAQSHLFGVATTLDGKLVGSPAHTTVKVGLGLTPDRRAREVAADVAAFVDGILLPGLPDGQVVALSLTLGGQIRDGDVFRSYNLAWDLDQALPLQRRLTERLPRGVAVVVENDARALADRAWWFGEWRKWFPDAPQPPRTFLTVLVTPTGIGGGFYLNGRRFEGGTGINGEIGHDKFDRNPEAPVCRCGRRGCVEVFAPPTQMLAKLGRKDLRKTAAAEDDQARAVFSLGGSALGAGIASFINHVGPDAVVVFAPEDLAEYWRTSTSLSRRAGTGYWSALRETLRRETFPGGEETRVAVVGLPDNVGPYVALGAAASALDTLIQRFRNAP